MHIVIAIVGLLGAAAFWWYRMQHLGKAANEVVDQVGRVQGHFRRNKMRKKAAVAPVAAIDDPIVAATTVVMAIAAEDIVVSEALQARVRNAIEPIAASPEKLDEAMIYAKWATDQVADVRSVIDQTTNLLNDKLNEQEKEQLVAMVQTVTLKEERHALYAQRIDRLRRKLGLTSTQ